LEADEGEAAPRLTAGLARQVAVEAALAAPPGVVLNRLLAGAERGARAEFLAHKRFLAVARADLGTLAGVLELERGDPAAAAGRFAEALDLYAAARPTAPALPGE